jgi:hypothetical protein
MTVLNPFIGEVWRSIRSGKSFMWRSSLKSERIAG